MHHWWYHDGDMGLPNSKTMTFRCETIAWPPAFETWFRKIENHPNRNALQQDLRQNQSFNLFSQESKQRFLKLGTSNFANYMTWKRSEEVQKKKYFQGVHDWFVRDDKFRKNMMKLVEPKICRPNGWSCGRRSYPPFENCRSNWWIFSNKIGSDTMPNPAQIWFKQALSTLKQKVNRNQRWTQSYSSSWWSWQGTWSDSSSLRKSPWRRTQYWLIKATW